MTVFKFLDGLSLTLQTCFVMFLLQPYCCCLVCLLFWIGVLVCFFIWLLLYYSIGSLIRTVFLSAMEKITGKILGLLTKGKILVSLSLAKKKKVLVILRWILEILDLESVGHLFLSVPSQLFWIELNQVWNVCVWGCCGDSVKDERSAEYILATISSRCAWRSRASTHTIKTDHHIYAKPQIRQAQRF